MDKLQREKKWETPVTNKFFTKCGMSSIYNKLLHDLFDKALYFLMNNRILFF